MTFASGSFGQLRYISEAVKGVTPVTGNGTNLRMTAPTMKAAVVTTKSSEIRADRMSTGLTRTDLNIDGGFNFELSAKEYDPFLAGILCSSFADYGTGGLGTVFGATTAADSVTADVGPTGTSAFSGLAEGSWFKLVPPAGAAQNVKDYFANAWFKVSSTTAPTPTVITLDPSTQIMAPGLVTDVAGFAVSQSVVSNGTTENSFTLEYELSDIAQFLAFRGMQVNTFDLSVAVGAIITGTFGFMGSGHDGMVAATSLPGSPAASQTLEVMNAVTDVGAIYEAGASVLGAGSFIKSLKFSVSNNMRGQKAVAVYGNAGVGLGELAIGGTLEVYLADAAYYQKWFNGVNTSLAIGLADAAGNGYMLEMDKVTFENGALAVGANNADTMLSLPFSAFVSPTSGRGLRITRAIAA